jgi:hypothetical protein
VTVKTDGAAKSRRPTTFATSRGSTWRTTRSPAMVAPSTPGIVSRSTTGSATVASTRTVACRTQRLERVGHDRTTGSDDRHGIAERLHLGQDVAGEQDCTALRPNLSDRLAEALLHHGVEAGGGLVEEKQLGIRAQRSDEGDLLPVALGIGSRPASGIELEALEERVTPVRVLRALQATDHVDALAPGETGPEHSVARHVREAAVQDRAPRAMDRGRAR